MPILTDEERLGTILAEKYELSGVLGSGGMGTVFAGTHTWTGRRVAVKLLKPELASDEGVRRRFLSEARAAATLQHPNVVDVLDMGATEDGTVYLVLEHLAGRTLADRLAEEGALSEADTLAVLLPVIDALSDAHESGFLHRDIKPENIFLTSSRDGSVIPKLLDFGLVKALEADGGSMKTATGLVLGTPMYMSPEQASGAPDLTPATDVWSMGVVCFECLSGQLPFRGNTLTAILLAIVTSRAPPLRSCAPEIDPRIAAAVDRALAPDLEERFETIAMFAAELTGAPRAAVGPARVSSPAAVAQTRPAVPVTRPATPAVVRPRRWPAIAAGLSLLAASALVGGLVLWLAFDARPSTPPAAEESSSGIEVGPVAVGATGDGEDDARQAARPDAQPDAGTVEGPEVEGPEVDGTQLQDPPSEEIARPAPPPPRRPVARSARASNVRGRTGGREEPAPPREESQTGGAADRPSVRGW